MRRSGLWIIAGLLLSAAGGVLGWAGLWLTRGVPVWEDRLRTYQTLSFSGFLAIFGGLVLAAIAFAVHRKRRQLEAGTGVLARWRVAARDLEAFHRADVARDGLFRSLRNRLRLPVEPPPEGLEISIGTDAMLVGDGCYGLGYFASRGKLVDAALVEGQPAMLEFTTSQQSENSSRLAVFRIPVPDDARDRARAALDHFEKTIDPRRRERVRKHYAPHYRAATGDPGEARLARAENRRRNWRATGAACLIVGGLILAILWSRTPGPNADPGAIRLLAIGAAIAVAAGLVALALSFRGRR